MNAPITPKHTHASDRAFLRQLKVANRTQLRAMLAVFTSLVPDGSSWSAPFAFKRAAVERKLGINRTTFPWVRK